MSEQSRAEQTERMNAVGKLQNAELEVIVCEQSGKESEKQSQNEQIMKLKRVSLLSPLLSVVESLLSGLGSQIAPQWCRREQAPKLTLSPVRGVQSGVGHVR